VAHQFRPVRKKKRSWGNAENCAGQTDAIEPASAGMHLAVSLGIQGSKEEHHEQPIVDSCKAGEWSLLRFYADGQPIPYQESR